jgi:hypothetical protein
MLERRAKHGKHKLTKGGTVRRVNPDGTQSNLGLAAQVNWGTPKSTEWKGSGPVGGEGHAHDLSKSNLKAQVMEPDSRAQLNPAWVEMLQGYPQGWTDISGPPVQDSPSTHGSRRALHRRNHTARKDSRRWGIQLSRSVSIQSRLPYANGLKRRIRRKV